MQSEEKSAPETIDSIKYLDELTGATDDEEEEAEQPEETVSEANAADTASENQETAEPVREEYTRPYAAGYSPLPDERKQIPFWKRTMSFRNTVIIGILTFAIGLASAGVFAKNRINDLNGQLAEKDEQIQALEEQNAELQEQLDNLPLNGDNYDFSEFFEQFGELFGDYGSWFGVPDNGGENVFPVPSNHGYLGIRVEETEDGVRVVDTLPNAKTDAFKTDDMILEVDGTKVETIDDISKVLEETEQGDTVEVLVKRGNREEMLDIELTGRYQEPVELTPGNSQEF